MNDIFSYFNQFCRHIFGEGYTDQSHTKLGITLWFMGNKVKTVDDNYIIEAINLNTNIEVIKLTDSSEGTDRYRFKDGDIYKIIFTNGILYEKKY